MCTNICNVQEPQVQPALRLRNVSQTFDGTKGVSVERLDIAIGKITAIVGASGCGKSTFLHLISGMTLLERTTEESEIALSVRSGSKLKQIDALKEGWGELRREIGFVFQEDYLIHAASGRDNLLLSLATSGQTFHSDEFENLWRDLGLFETGADPDKISRDYSGGMKQRVAIGRALVRDPSILFADEPTANLDPRSAKSVMELLVKWTRDKPHRTLILVTHDLEATSEFADEIVVMVKTKEAPAGQNDEKINEIEQPGRLAPGYQFPIENPRDRFVLEELMYASEQLVTVSPPNQATPIDQICMGERSDPASARQIVSWIGRVGMAIATDPEKRSGGRSTALNRGFIALLTYAKPFLLMIALLAWSVFFLYRFFGLDLSFLSAQIAQSNLTWISVNQTFSEWMLFPELASLYESILGVEYNKVPARWMWGFGLSVLAIQFLLFKKFFGHLGDSAATDAAVFSSLLAAAVLLQTGGEFATAAFEEDLSDPNIQPVLVQAGSQKLNGSWIEDTETAFKQLWLKSSNENADLSKAVFGRFHKLSVRAYLPRYQHSSDVAVCKDSSADFVPLNILAPTPEEPMGSGLSFRRLPTNSAEASGQSDWFERKFLADLAYVPPPDTGGTTSVFAQQPSDRAEIILTDEAVRLFHVKQENHFPSKVCLDLQSTRFDRSDDTIFDIVGIVEKIPKFDIRRYDALVSQDVGSLLVHRTPYDEGLEFSFAAIWIDPGIRKESVEKISRLQKDGELRTLPGFQALERALVAADQSAAAREYLMLFVLAIGVFIIYRIIAGIMSKLSRELAVARAFGARFYHLAILLIASTFRSVLLALLIVTVGVYLLADPFVTWAYEEVPQSLVGRAPWYTALFWSSLGFLGVWIVTIFTYLAWMTITKRSIADQMKETG